MQSTFYIPLHIGLTQNKLRLKKELKYILIHNNTLQLALSDQVLQIKNPCFPFGKVNIFVVVSLQK